MHRGRVYLDHAAGTPMLPAAVQAMSAVLGRTGNASSTHTSGRTARALLEDAREQIAAAVGAQPAEIVLTSGGTEADNLAVKGLAWAGATVGRDVLVSSVVEHHAVLDPLVWLADGSTPVRWLPVDGTARIDLDALRRILLAEGERVGLISVMWANNEVGTVQPLDEVVALAAPYGIPVHSDAVQALGHVPVDFAASGLDAMTITGHKLGGPVGIGALVARRGLSLVPVQHGGGQERDVRSGTVDVAAAVGFATAVTEAVARQEAEYVRVRALRDHLVAAVLDTVSGVSVNGCPEGLPGIANLSFEGCDGDALLMLLDAAGVDCSVGSACAAGVSQTSHVLLAAGRSPAEAASTLRFSLGHTTTPAEVETLLAVLPDAVVRARAAGPLG